MRFQLFTLSLLSVSSIQSLKFKELFSNVWNEKHELVYGYSTVTNNTINVLLGKVLEKKGGSIKMNSKLYRLDLTQTYKLSPESDSEKVVWKGESLGQDYIPVYGSLCFDNSTLKTICYGGNYLSDTSSVNSVNRFQVWDRQVHSFDTLHPKLSVSKNRLEKDNFTETGLTPRVGGQAVKVGSQTFLVGGLHPSPTSNGTGIEVWVLDKDVLTQVEYPALSIKPQPRFFFSLTKVSKTQLLLVGGRDKDQVFGLNQVYLFDTVSRTWSVVKTSNPPNHGFHSHTATVWFNPITQHNELILYGGADQDGIPLKDSLYALDLIDYTFTKLSLPKHGNLVSGRFGHLATLIDPTTLLVYFGSYPTPNFSTILLDLITLSEIDYFKGINPTQFNLQQFINQDLVFQQTKPYFSGFTFIVVILLFASLGYFAYKKFIDGNHQFLPLPTNDQEIDMEEAGFDSYPDSFSQNHK